MYGEVGFSFFSGQTLKNDSLKMTWFANDFYWIYKADLFSKKEWIDLTFGAGPVFGSQRCLLTQNTNHEVYKNFFCAIVPTACLRIQIGKHFALGGDLSYIYDFSDTLWKGRFRNFHSHKSSFNGRMVRVFIGCVI